MPSLGLGTWVATGEFVGIEQLKASETKEKGVEPEKTIEIIKKAIDCGYRHIDTALMYGNEKEIGEAIQQKIKDKTVTSIRNNCTEVPDIILNNGCKMPSIGLGTWGATGDFVGIENLGMGEQKEKGIEPKEMVEIIKKAIDCGYRHFDTALMYGNEKEIGEAIQQKIKDKTVTSLQNLKLDYIDLYLIHSPLATQSSDDTLYPKTKDGKLAYSDVDYVCTWRAMEDLVEKGLCKSIGISNFNKKQVERLLEFAKIVPQNHQIEDHPYLSQKPLTGYCTVLDIAKKHDKSPAQILIRYQLEQGHAAVPNAGASEQFMRENINVFDFYLRPEDMAALHYLNAETRYFKFTGATGHPHHPFET
uniref:NADP-dependent oxidoreductase domain-containing protein n=1 Tax=Glossina brevipalpis TaxID=37001 RepID=A0A1A9W800_9MUSC